jgi:aspartate/methionine/tyrosine aminotransferase
MKIKDFALERYFAKHEFTAKYLLSSSDCDGYELSYILENALPEDRKLWNNLKLGYTESAGHPLLRESILQFYQADSLDNVVVASPGELNFISMNVLLTDKDHVITIAPAYQSLHEVVRSIGCEISYWTPNPLTWSFNVDDLARLIQANTRLIVINFPHNPTGSYLDRNALDKLIALARANSIYIFSDEMYHKLNFDPAFPELSPVCDLYEKGISLWGTSKTFGLAGLRTGWIVSQDQAFLNQVVSFKDYLSICNSAPAEILSLMALNTSERYIEPNVQKIQQNINAFKAFTKKHSALIEFIPPKAGSTSFVKLNIKGDITAFCDHMVEKAGIMAVPSSMFNYQGNYIRIGFGRKNLPVILSELDKYLATAIV